MRPKNSLGKRKARSDSDFKRGRPTRAVNPRILIVCEGTKTEPRYFYDMLYLLKVRPKAVIIEPNNGSCPDRVVTHAFQLFGADALSGDRFDRVYCVFDRDKHVKFDDALQRIKMLNQEANLNRFFAITSTPCFEFWLLLHFGFTSKPFNATGKKSACDTVLTDLKTKDGFAGYGKGKSDICALLESKTDDAIRYAKRLRDEATLAGQTNPSTNVDVLVEELRRLSPKYT